MHEIRVSARSQAPREVVWGLLADADAWHRWGPWDSSGLERDGTPERGGVGARRFVARGRIVTREEVTAFEPQERMDYRLVSGLPLKDYRAEVTLADAEGGTEILWHSRFEGARAGTGPLFRLFLARVIARVAKGLAREAERVAAG